MSHRLEVLPGPGTVVRHGDVAVWAGPAASAALLSFLIQSARNVGDSARGGLQIVDHVAGILSTRDPEPGAPFAVIGPSSYGWVTLLHGPVQLWDGSRWLAPTPNPGWLRSDVTPQPAVSIGPAGGASPRLSADSPYDLRAGTVPGGGLLLVPDPTADRGTGGPVEARGYRDGPNPVPVGVPAARPSTASPSTGSPSTGSTSTGSTSTGSTSTGSPSTSGFSAGGLPGRPLGAQPPAPGLAPPGPGPVPPATPGLPLRGPAGSGAVAPPGVRAWASLLGASAAPRPALPIGEATSPAGRPQVVGIRCSEGHLNHPAMTACGWCARPISSGQPAATGPRPVLGVLIAADDGETFRVDVDQVLGTDPTTDQGVAGGRLRGVRLTGAPGQLAPAHAELRLDDWTLAVVDRGSAAGTFVVPAGSTGWTRLTPYQPATLTPGSHLSLGQRVLTYLSPWPG